MRMSSKIRTYLNADSAKDDMTDAESEKEAFQQVMNFVDWYWEEVSK